METAAFNILGALLDKGASNAHTALELALELCKVHGNQTPTDTINQTDSKSEEHRCHFEGLDSLVGLLLKHLGCDKNGNVAWCNLNLKTFSHSWLQTIILGPQAEDGLLRNAFTELALITICYFFFSFRSIAFKNKALGQKD